MSIVSEISDFQTMQFEEVPLQNLFDIQKAYFATDVTKTYEWRIDQLDRLIRMLKDNYERFSDASRKDFKTAAQENAFEVSASIATAEYTKSQLKDCKATTFKLAIPGSKCCVKREVGTSLPDPMHGRTSERAVLYNLGAARIAISVEPALTAY